MKTCEGCLLVACLCEIASNNKAIIEEQKKVINDVVTSLPSEVHGDWIIHLS